ncbi:ParA family protein [Motilimonas pumila]|uniref:ParA family protein n=1 Tax=Motilimonas pumila TaxID=2303987 RepID=A0A418YA31_9GAMM|nr:AAA family ATPase [Motilimonas pumila]RJG38789.1 ParA family protein [Motilimonas pumila]
MSKANTTAIFQELKENADRYRHRRNSRLLLNSQKERRNFTRAEGIAYLDLDGKTLDKYVAMAEIDPRRHEDSQWSVDISEIYKVRDLLPPNLRRTPKFVRGDKRELQVFVIQNQKGGVGKTISAVTAASGLATEFHEEFRVGLIDLDGQRTASMYYAPEAELDDHLSVGDLMMKNYDLDEGETHQDVVSSAFLPTTIPNLRILPASQTDRSIEGWFHEKIFNGEIENPYELLKSIIDSVEQEFDIIIIDTPPSLGFMTYNAYFAASSVIFPLSLTENDMDATCSYFSYIPHVWTLLKNAGHPGYDVMKILLTNHKESAATTELQNKVEEHFGRFIFSKEFKNSEAIKQCSAYLSSVFDMSKSEYPKTKSTFLAAHQNAYEVTSQIMREINNLWREQENK